MDRDITDSKKFLNKIVTVKVDRPMGSEHPKHNLFPALY